jgi:A/G-specific adenine glycosylase
VKVSLKKSDYSKIRKKILNWFRQNARVLPWRIERTPYKIWISEVMLQQTQVNQVIPYYQKFISFFPDINSLAAASQQEVLKVWEGMGYYARARNLHRAAEIIITKYNGIIPREKSELLNIPGFGPYISNAVLSLAYQKPYGVMDGNVIRVITRVFGIREDIRLYATRKKIDTIIQQLLDKHYPGDFNEALMEIGAMLCLPKSPSCQTCPFSQHCVAKNLSLTDTIPYKSRKTPKPLKHSDALFITCKSKVLIARRKEHGLLGGLWEFPTIEKSGEQNALNPVDNQKEFNLTLKFFKACSVIRHSYTHFNLILYPKCYVSSDMDFKSSQYAEYRWVDWKEIGHFPTHRAMQKVLQTVDENSEIVSQGQIKDPAF